MNIPSAAFHPGFGGGAVRSGRGAGGDSAPADGEAAWFLSREVYRSLDQIVASVDDCLEALPTPLRSDRPAPQERFVMQQSAGPGGGGADTAKCVLVMEGPALVQAELQVKIHKHPNTIHKTSIQPDAPWNLTQLQDAANLLAEARRCADEAGRLRAHVDARLRSVGAPDAAFLRRLTARLTSCADSLLLRLRRGRDALLSPRKRTIQDHLSSENMRSLRPPLPGDIAVSFYVQGARLVLAVYHLVPQRGSLMFDMFLAECCLPRLEQALAALSRTFQMAQELKVKLTWAARCHQQRPRYNRPVPPPARPPQLPEPEPEQESEPEPEPPHLQNGVL